jgi:methyltransferase-like protein
MANRQMARDMQVEFQARFQAKQARREAQKAAKQDPILKKQIQDLLKKGETQKAYQKAKMLLSKQALAQQMDQMADMAELSAAQIQANNSMNRMTQMMAQSSRTMNVAQKNTNPEKVSTFVIYSIPTETNNSPDSRYSRAVQAAKRRIRHVQRHLPGRHHPVHLYPSRRGCCPRTSRQACRRRWP